MFAIINGLKVGGNNFYDVITITWNWHCANGYVRRKIKWLTRESLCPQKKTFRVMSHPQKFLHLKYLEKYLLSDNKISQKKTLNRSSHFCRKFKKVERTMVKWKLTFLYATLTFLFKNESMNEIPNKNSRLRNVKFSRK